MTYSDEGIYIPREYGSTSVTVTRNGKDDICRLCHTSMEAIPHGQRRNTESVRGSYAGYAVRA